MHHVVFLVKRRSDLAPEAFAHYWRETHTPLAARIPGVRTLRIYPATGPQPGEPQRDGVAILGFDDAAAFQAATQSPEFAATVADIANFAAVAETTPFFAGEHIIV